MGSEWKVANSPALSPFSNVLFMTLVVLFIFTEKLIGTVLVCISLSILLTQAAINVGNKKLYTKSLFKND